MLIKAIKQAVDAREDMLSCIRENGFNGACSAADITRNGEELEELSASYPFIIQYKINEVDVGEAFLVMAKDRKSNTYSWVYLNSDEDWSGRYSRAGTFHTPDGVMESARYYFPGYFTATS